MQKQYDIYIVGLGGQGVLTIGDLLAQAGLAKDMAVNFYPRKGMSQRGGFVQGQLRFGRENVGASLPRKGADLVVSMERSEALKGVGYCKPGCDFLLYDDVWITTDVIAKKEKYPELKDVQAQITATGAKLYCLSSDGLPQVNGVPVRANMFILGALLSNTSLKALFSLEDILAALQTYLPKNVESNLAAVQAGYAAALQPV